jgi:hypothetical protein
MSTQPDVDGLIRETRRYEFADGLVELQMGVLLTIMGALSQLVFSPKLIHLSLSLSQTLGSWARWLTVLIVLLPTLAAFGTRHIVKYVRRRWLWRTSGFVEPLPSAVPRKALTFATATVVVSVAVAFALSRAGWGEPMLPLRVLVASVGWAQGITMIGVGRTTGLAHYAWLGIVGGSASTSFLFLHLTFGQAWLAFCLLWGLAFTASGLFSLRCALLRLREANQDG